eukprot:211663-Pelagomonas_calceolata.AAC.2
MGSFPIRKYCGGGALASFSPFCRKQREKKILHKPVPAVCIKERPLASKLAPRAHTCGWPRSAESPHPVGGSIRGMSAGMPRSSSAKKQKEKPRRFYFRYINYERGDPRLQSTPFTECLVLDSGKLAGLECKDW